MNHYPFNAPLNVQKYERYLPNAFDESLTILEKINKIISYINHLSCSTNDLIDEWNQLIEWIQDDGLREIVIEKMNEWLANGDLSVILEQLTQIIKTFENETNDNLLKKHDNNEFISVIREGIKNDGSVIHSEINDLIKQSYGKTLFFPAGVYNLSESINLPYEYVKNVHLIFDDNAIVKSSLQLDSLIKVGFTEISATIDKTLRKYNYIKGGQFDLENADCGIEINGLKQLVNVDSCKLFNGKKYHIRIHTSNDFVGSGSADETIKNVLIQGKSSNENNYGIYIEQNCLDCQIIDTLIYGVRTNMHFECGGHILRNIHTLSQILTGGLDLGSDNFKNTVGIEIVNNIGLFLENVYFDTCDVCIKSGNFSPKLMLTNCIFYSYLNSVGSSFYQRDSSVTSTLELSLINCSISIPKDNYQIIDARVPLGFENFSQLSMSNLIISYPERIFYLDPYLSQEARKKSNDFITQSSLSNFDDNWVILGCFKAFLGEAHYNFCFSSGRSLDMYFTSGLSNLQTATRDLANNFSITLAKATVNYNGDNYTILAFKSNAGMTGNPIMSHISGAKPFLRTPYDNKKYTLSDYGIDESWLQIILDRTPS